MRTCESQNGINKYTAEVEKFGLQDSPLSRFRHADCESNSMKTLMISLALLMLTALAFAAEPSPTILQIKPPEQSRVQTNLGVTQIHSHAADIRVAWLPLLAPLPYSYPRTTQEIPNALVLTGTQIPQRSRTFRTVMQ